MAFTVLGLTARGIVAAALSLSLAITLAITLGARGAAAQDKPQDKTYVMKIGTPTVNDTPENFVRLFGPMVEKDSGGRIKIELYSASKLGPMAREIEGLQFGSIECAIIPPEFFVGVDERFELPATPGLVDSLAHGQRLSAQADFNKLMLGLGADKGLHGIAIVMALPSSLISKAPIRHLADMSGKKIRVTASKLQLEAFGRLGASPVALSTGDILPALQQGAIDGSISGITVYNAMHFQDAAKYVSEIGQPAIFLIIETSKRWFEALPKDLQEIVDRDAAAAAAALSPTTATLYDNARKSWTDNGGELISFPADEQAAMMKTFAGVGEDVAKAKPQLYEAYKVVTDAAKRTR
jgi:TRAP-type C4-dicarboxylate transport system substrate-binding protein